MTSSLCPQCPTPACPHGHPACHVFLLRVHQDLGPCPAPRSTGGFGLLTSPVPSWGGDAAVERPCRSSCAVGSPWQSHGKAVLLLGGPWSPGQGSRECHLLNVVNPPWVAPSVLQPCQGHPDPWAAESPVTASIPAKVPVIFLAVVPACHGPCSAGQSWLAAGGDIPRDSHVSWGPHGHSQPE